MGQLGGEPEAHAQFKQYEHRANSSLVLTTDSRPRDSHEPTGEPESLWGKIDPKGFGDRAFRGRPSEGEEKPKRRPRPAGEPSPRKRRRVQTESVLTSSEEGMYQPKTRETRAAYEAMLSLIQSQLGGKPLAIVNAAADEILAVLKNDALRNLDKKKEIENLLNPIPAAAFDQLVSIGRLVTDFHGGGGDAGAVEGDEALDENVCVAVDFEENEEVHIPALKPNPFATDVKQIRRWFFLLAMLMLFGVVLGDKNVTTFGATETPVADAKCYFRCHDNDKPNIVMVSLLVLGFFLFAALFSLSGYCWWRNVVLTREPATDVPEVDPDVLLPSVADTFDVVRFQADEELGQGDDCPICLHDFVEGEELRRFPICNHVYHHGCIGRWVRRGRHCPICRTGIVAEAPLVVDPPAPAVEDDPSVTEALLVVDAPSVADAPL